MTQFKDVGKRGGEWIVAGALGAVAALLYFCTMASCAYPGEGAHLMTLWKGLDSAAVNVHPLMAIFARLFGCSNILGPLCGIVSVISLYHLTSFFVRERIDGEMLAQYADSMGRMAGIVASVIFMTTPAVHQSFVHLSSFSFDAAWALVTASLLIPYARAGKNTGWIYPVLIGVFAGLGFADSPLFGLLALGYFSGVWAVSGKRGGKPYGKKKKSAKRAHSSRFGKRASNNPFGMTYHQMLREGEMQKRELLGDDFERDSRGHIKGHYTVDGFFEPD